MIGSCWYELSLIYSKYALCKKILEKVPLGFKIGELKVTFTRPIQGHRYERSPFHLDGLMKVPFTKS